MKDEKIDEDWIPNRDSGYTLPEPSEFLREKILSDASNAWTEDLKEGSNITWVIPALRLAASITISILIVSFANRQSQHTLAHLQSTITPTIPSENLDSYDQWIEQSSSLMKIRKVAISSRNQGTPKDLILYMQRLREITEDTIPSLPPIRPHSTKIQFSPWQLNHFNNPPTSLQS